MTSSVGCPALTMTITARGRSRDATNAAIESDGTNEPSSPCCATSDSVRAVVRLCSATVWPCRARLRARFRPMTARPLTPMFAGARSLMTSTVVAAFPCVILELVLIHGGFTWVRGPTGPRNSRMATEIYADIRTALAHSRRVAHAPLRWDPVGHLLSRFGFGPTPGTRAAVAKNGYEWWLTHQTYLGAHQGGYRAHQGGAGHRAAADALALRRASVARRAGRRVRLDDHGPADPGDDRAADLEPRAALREPRRLLLQPPQRAQSRRRHVEHARVLRPRGHPAVGDARLHQHAVGLSASPGHAHLPQPGRLDQGRDQRELRT